MKLYATLVALSFAAGVVQIGYAMAADDIGVAERGLGCIAGAMGGIVLGFATLAVVALWAA